MKKAVLTIALAAAAVLGTATPAFAHNVLVSSDPPKGASVETGPSKITLTFDAPVQPGNNQLAVTGPDGNQWTDGGVEVASNVVSAPVRPLGPAGVYKVGYRILSADGHPVSGETEFTLTKAGTGTPAAAKPADQDTAKSSGSSGVPVWVWLVGAVVVLGAGLTLALRTGSGSAKEDKKS
ncbi:copper resistance CopC family protein [Amycolatopsis sp. CA-230715]|uniref:copper resistance CopC family protein n=1 Tax=Amycolatopsis sp. CA-230715 TaxID=2745196 RepID=UPI001C0127C8|nr:copper resistance CopC family protein [Amycolatopsis sp. CA-230715]QWF80341.1 hypothetical protein HUW46_03761 [Amycolatopsis sp. CA-230715]